MRLALGLVIAAFVLTAQNAFTVYYNGKIVTLWPRAPVAQAVLVRENRFASVGSNDEVLKLAGSGARRIDLKGRTVLPGLIDSHTHPIGAALSEQDGPVPVMDSIDDVVRYIREQAQRTPPGRVIFVPKVYSTRLKERRYPTRYELDAAAPGRAAMADNGYASVLNSLLLAKLGITRDTPAPANGKIIRDEKGEPTGLILGAPQLLRPLRQSRTPTFDDLLWALEAIKAVLGSGSDLHY